MYSSVFGRRKTWIVPAQAAIGALLLWASPRVGGWLEGGVDGEPDVSTLTSLFLTFYFLAATQDIAVDGLALTILSPRNKELGATCNAIGQSVGYFLAFLGLQALGSANFCNNYLRGASAQSDAGMVSLGGFMAFWAYVFLASTLWVTVAKVCAESGCRSSTRSSRRAGQQQRHRNSKSSERQRPACLLSRHRSEPLVSPAICARVSLSLSLSRARARASHL